jgi:restriction endonuclease S subunit
MTGKVLGQFFTQPLVKKMMVKLIDPQIHPDGKIDTCGDPTMGTGGFLITYLQEILQQAKSKNIEPDWEFIKTNGLYGKELDPDTYQLAVSNMLISSGHYFKNLERGDSIRFPITKKFDNVLANPPFGIKGLKYDDFNSPLRSEYVPIKTDNAVSLFIQAIIHMLKINGKCAVVLPDGQDLFSKTNTALVEIREYLMKTCDLKEIIYLPAGIFDNTSIKTCIFYFVKKMEGSDVLETNIKFTKTQKEKGRSYKFVKTHQTASVKFYDYNQLEDVKVLLVEVPIEKIVSNSYSLNYAEYMKDKNEEQHYEEGVVVKTLGEVCEIQNGKRIVKGQVETGEYPVLGGGGFTSFYTNEYSREGKTCKISREGMSLHNCVMLLNEKYYLNSQAFTIKSKNETIVIDEYLWYYLDNNKEQVFKCGRGTAQKAIDIDEFKSIKIPIPSLERQQEIVKYLDFIHEKANKTSDEKIAELKQLNEFCLNNQRMFGENVVKTLGEVCKFNIGGTPSRSKNEYYENGNNLWVSVRELNGGYIYDTKEKITDLGVQNSSVKLFAKDTTLFSFKLSIGKTAIVGNPLYTNEAIAGISSKNNDLLNDKYLYYYLTINDFSKLGSGILGNGSLNKKSLEQIKITIPSIERQTEIVEYCEYNDTLIKQLEKEIENNKKQAQQFIMNAIKSPAENTTIHQQSETQSEDEMTQPLQQQEQSALCIEEKTTAVKKVKKTKKRILVVNQSNTVLKESTE